MVHLPPPPGGRPRRLRARVGARVGAVLALVAALLALAAAPSAAQDPDSSSTTTAPPTTAPSTSSPTSTTSSTSTTVPPSTTADPDPTTTSTTAAPAEAEPEGAHLAAEDGDLAPPPAEAAAKVVAMADGAEGPDWMPIATTAQLWCTWNANPGCGGHHSTPALDIGLSVGTPVYAAGPGTVIDVNTTCGSGDSGCSSGRGRFVAIQHPDGRFSRYLHLSVVVVTSGAVGRGQLIGYSGDTGSTSAPHLHYDELTDYTNTTRVDPGTMYAMWGATTVVYPSVVGYGSWTQTPYGTNLRNDGYEEPPSPPPPPPPANGATFTPVTPYRQLDSREVGGAWGGLPVGNGRSRTLKVAGEGAVPANASAVVLTVTATGGTLPSYLTAFPAGAAVPNAASVVFDPGQTVTNLVTVAVGGNGGVKFYNPVGTVHVVVDVVGFYDDGSGTLGLFFGLQPQRFLDSRQAAGPWAGEPLGPGAYRSLRVRGDGLLPSYATSVVANVTVTGGTDATYVQTWPSDAARPNTANVLAGPGQSVPNLVISRIGSDGTIAFYNQTGTVHVVVDVVGFFGDAQAGGRFHPIAPARVIDTRQNLGGPPLDNDQARPFTFADGTVIPATATAVAFNATVVYPNSPSYLSMYPAGFLSSGTANLLFDVLQTRQNHVIVALSGGAATIYNQQGATHVVGDVAGYFKVG